MAKSKSPKAKSFSATIGFEQQIWDAACELWGTYPRCRLSQNLYRTYLLKIHLNRIWKEIQGTCRRRWWLWRRSRCIRSRQHFLCSARGTWSEIAKAAHTPEIGTILDKAMIAIEADNKSLKGVLPKNYAKPRTGQTRPW